MKYKIEIPEQITIDELIEKINNGARFIIYPYCISLFFAVTLKRFSKAYLIENHQLKTKYKRKYNNLSYLFGWWGIPWGVILTIEYSKLNNKGGLDVTDDIVANLTEENIKNKEVEISKIDKIFSPPENSVIKAIKKAIHKRLSNDILINELYAGVYLNSDDEYEVCYFISYSTPTNFGTSIEEVRKAIKKEFIRSVHFEFFNLEEDNEINQKLKKQGVRIL